MKSVVSLISSSLATWLKVENSGVRLIAAKHSNWCRWWEGDTVQTWRPEPMCPSTGIWLCLRGDVGSQLFECPRLSLEFQSEKCDHRRIVMQVVSSRWTHMVSSCNCSWRCQGSVLQFHGHQKQGCRRISGTRLHNVGLLKPKKFDQDSRCSCSTSTQSACSTCAIDECQWRGGSIGERIMFRWIVCFSNMWLRGRNARRSDIVSDLMNLVDPSVDDSTKLALGQLLTKYDTVH